MSPDDVPGGFLPGPYARTRWSDERLDDLRDVVMSLRLLPERIVEFRGEINEMRGDTQECRAGIDALVAELGKRAEQREAERKERERDRKSGRKWVVGVSLTTAMLVVAALSLIVSVST